MDYQDLQKFTSRYFWLIVAAGGLYVSLLIWVFLKSFPGMMMMILFVVNSKKYGYDIAELHRLSGLWSSTGLWLVSVWLLVRTVRAALGTWKMIVNTRKFVAGLKIVSREVNKRVFDSEEGEIFTAGIFHPTIYMSKNLKRLHDMSEILAMVAHEERHVVAKDPLRVTVTSMISKSLPFFPGKEKLFRSFYTLTEICADKSAEDKLENKLPVISALYKRLKMTNKNLSLGISFFNSQSERIRVLVGKESIEKKRTILVGMSTLAVLILIALALGKIDYYYCQHLLRCVTSFDFLLEFH